MREILFRGKRVDNGEWVYGNFIKIENETYIFEQYEVKVESDTYKYLDSYRMSRMHNVSPDTVGQYTNLKDKHSAGIFEGDVVEIPYEGWKLIKWFDCHCGFEPFSDSFENCGHCGCGADPEDCIVLGNIHDNPELMNRVNRYPGE